MTLATILAYSMRLPRLGYAVTVDVREHNVLYRDKKLGGEDCYQTADQVDLTGVF